MSEDLIKTIEKLLESGVGNVSELEYILKLLREGRHIPSFDQRYLEKIIVKKNIAYRGYNQYKSEGTSLVLSLLFGSFGFMGFGHRYVGNIGRSLVILYSGWILSFLNFLNFYPFIASSVFHQESFYPYSYYPALVQGIVTYFHLDVSSSTVLTFVIIIGLPVGYFALFIWQIFDARNLTRNFNEFMDKKGIQLYELTTTKKAIFVIVVCAPIIASVSLLAIYYTASFLHLIPVHMT